MSDQRVIYASSTSGIHDQRWTAALEACGFHVTVLDSASGLRSAVDAFEPRSAPVLAGPLSTVTRLLVGLNRPVIGLSWGYDLQQDHSESVPLDSLTWLSDLDGLVVDSYATRDISLLLGMPAERITMIPWGVDLNDFTPNGPAVSALDHGFAPGSRVVLSLRTHDTLYRTGDVIEAFARAALVDPSLMLVMGGDGPLTTSHQARVAELGMASRVRFIGRVAESELPALLRGADLYVTASETDGTSVTLLQAMACGTPVAASANAGNVTWIHEGRTGRLFAVGDTAALARLMVTTTEDQAHTTLNALALVESDANWNRNRLRLMERLPHGHV